MKESVHDVSEDNDGETGTEMFETVEEFPETQDESVLTISESSISKEPKESHSFYTVNTFLAFLTTFQLVNLLTMTYTDSVLNYIAKRFRIPNTMASFIPSSYQIGSMIAIIPVSYFGPKWHRPRVICMGVLVMLLGLGFCILPHFIMSPLEGSTNSSERLQCSRSRMETFNKYVKELELQGNTTNRDWNSLYKNFTAFMGGHSNAKTGTKNWFIEVLQILAKNYHAKNKLIKPSLSTPRELPCNENGTIYNPSILLILGHLLIGSGSSPLWPLGIAYLDDHLARRKLPMYLGFFIGLTLTGPVAGFLLGSLSSAIYVSLDAHDLKPTDPAWIGAWWLGYVIAGIILVLFLIPFFFFPSSLKISDEKQKELDEYKKLFLTHDTREEKLDDTENGEVASETSSIQDKCDPKESLPLLCQEETNKNPIWLTITDLICTIKSLVMNPIILFSITAYTVLANLLSGVSTFGSTYIQQEFNVLRITSDMLIGGVCLPLAIVGTFGGGYIMKRYNFDLKRILLFNLIISTSGTILISTLFLYGCDSPRTAGINQPYADQAITNVVSYCNSDCHCTKGELEYVCSSNHITYVSPCYAGCMTRTTDSGNAVKEVYEGCSCVTTTPASVTSGSCSTPNCIGVLAGAMISVALGIMLLCLCQAPAYTILIRELTAEDKSLGIGLLTFLSRILGFVPAPIWFALVIDKSCVYWGPKCKGKAVCKLYYLEGLRLSFVGACVLLALGYIITFGLTASWVWFKEGKENPSKYEVLNEPEKDGK